MGCANQDSYAIAQGSGSLAYIPAGDVGDVLLLYCVVYTLFAENTIIDEPVGWVDLAGSTGGRGNRLSARVANGTEGGSVSFTHNQSGAWEYWTVLRLPPDPRYSPWFEPAAGAGSLVPSVVVPDLLAKSALVIFIGGRQVTGGGSAGSNQGLCEVEHLSGNFYTPGTTAFLDCFPPGPTGDLTFVGTGGMDTPSLWARVLVPSRLGCGPVEAPPLRQLQRDDLRARQRRSQQRSPRAGWPNAYL